MNQQPPKAECTVAKPDEDKAVTLPRPIGTTGSRPIVGGSDPVKGEEEIERPIPVFLRLKPRE